MWDFTSHDCISRSLAFSFQGFIYVRECSVFYSAPWLSGTSSAKRNFQAVLVLGSRKLNWLLHLSFLESLQKSFDAFLDTAF